MRLELTTFKGISPKVSADLIEGNAAQIAQNVKFQKGRLDPWFNILQEQALQATETVITIYLYEDQYWLEWEADVDVVPSPVSGDTEAKLYYTGDGIPKKTNLALATTGAGALPIDFYPLSLPSPHDGAVAALGGGGIGDPRSITYLWTVVSSWGEESIVSPPSNIVLAMQGQTVNLSGMSLIWQAGIAYTTADFVYPTASEGGAWIYKCVAAGTSGGAEPTFGTVVDGDTVDGGVTWRAYHNNIVTKRIYRLNTGDTTASYQFVDEIDVTLTAYADSKTDTELAEVLTAQDYDPAPDSLEGLTYLSNGILLGFSGKDLYVSEAYRPWAWPIGFIISLPFTIVSIASMGQSALITTEENPFIVTGTDPQAISKRQLPTAKACVAKRSTVGYFNGACYASPDGITVVQADGSLNVFTKDKYSVEEWSALFPTTMHGNIHDNKYFLFYKFLDTEGGLVFDLLTGELAQLTFYSSATFQDKQADKLYLLEVTGNTRLLEDGTVYPPRTGARLTEDGFNRLLE